MGKLVRTPKEDEANLKTIAAPEFYRSEQIAITFQTTEEFVNEVIPAPLKPVEGATGSVSIWTYADSSPVGPYAGGCITLDAEYEGVVGSYCLAMPMSTDIATIFGRETMGEPKKIAQTSIVHEGDRVIGSIVRNGVELVRASVTPDEWIDGSVLGDGIFYHYKFTFNPDGSGLDHDPFLVEVTFTSEADELYTAKDPELLLAKTDDDIFGDVPIVAVTGATYIPCANVYGKSRYVATVDKTEFLPYAFYKVDPWDARNKNL